MRLLNLVKKYLLMKEKGPGTKSAETEAHLN